MLKRTYSGEKRREISFPLGGIGTGSIGLDGTGRFRDWEIFNHPSKGSLNGFSHFGIKVENGESVLDARVLNADYLGSAMGRYTESANYDGYGYGPDRYLLCGAPHFRDSIFRGEFPLAEVEFVDETFPGQVKMKAFNPFIPSNDFDSSIPAAFFTLEIANTTKETLDYTFELTVYNPAKCAHIHNPVNGEHFQGVELANNLPEDSTKYGSLLFAVDEKAPMQLQQYWYRGGWFDSLQVFWRDFTTFGPIRKRVYEYDGRQYEDLATIAVKVKVAPGETVRQRFLIAWYYPNMANYWSDRESKYPSWKNYYAKCFQSVSAVAEYAFSNWDRLEAETERFHDALFASDLPETALEAVSANLSTLKSATVLRLEDGQFYGFEGCQSNNGCCEGSCTHVWNYAFALPFLFPKLERSMRELDYTYNQHDNGGMEFRLQLPLGRERTDFHSCVDGLMGGVIKVYREWKICGDTEWLKTWWPKVKKSLEFAWNPTNKDRWDPECSGVITGRQHHTLDMELFGPNAWLNGFYVGALKAASEMAEVMGDHESAKLYHRLYEQGRAFTDEELFNGEYYCQKVDIRDEHILDPFEPAATLIGDEIRKSYWDEEAGQLKYQIDEGCGEDQVLAQWMCELSGVGEILDPEHVNQALHAIYRNNFKPSLRKHFNPCRIYGLNDDAGMVICSWPAGKEKPVVPIPYAEEVMHGFEYQAAIHMLMHGMETECMNVVNGIRRRYDGEKRNPWNEIECGSNYARSMASYALLLAYSGFRYDMTENKMGFLPIHKGRYFWSLDGAWGTCRVEENAELRVLYGTLKLKKWILPDCEHVAEVNFNGKPVDFSVSDGTICLTDRLEIHAGDCLTALYRR